MDNRITVNELYDFLSKEIENGNGDKKISIQEYFLGKNLSSDKFAVYVEGIFYEDVEYSEEETKWLNDSVMEHKKNNPELWELPDLSVANKDEDIKKYFNYIADQMNKENIDVETRKLLKEEVINLRKDIQDEMLMQYSHYVVECLDNI